MSGRGMETLVRLRFSGLWRRADFLRLWSGQTISVFGSFIGGSALQFTAVLVLDATPLQMAMLAAATLLPGFLIGLFAGAWVDRLRRRPILIVTDVGRALVLVSIPLAWLFDLLSMEQLYAVAFLTGALTLFFDVASLSYLPTLVRREELVEANSKLAASSAASEVAGFGVAGWLVQLITGPLAILLDAVSFLGSALFLGSIRTPEPEPGPAATRQSVWREIADGVHVVLASPLLRATAASATILDLSMRVYGTVILLYVVRELGFDPGVLGMIFAVGGLSSLVGSLVAGRAGRTLGLGRVMALGLVVFGLSQLLVPLAAGPAVVVALFLVGQQLGDGAYVVREVNEVSLRQAVTPRPVLGRMNASFRFAGLAAMLLGTLIGGVLGDTIGLRPTLVVGACGTFVAALWLLLSPVRNVAVLPDAAQSVSR